MRAIFVIQGKLQFRLQDHFVYVKKLQVQTVFELQFFHKPVFLCTHSRNWNAVCDLQRKVRFIVNYSKDTLVKNKFCHLFICNPEGVKYKCYLQSRKIFTHCEARQELPYQPPAASEMLSQKFHLYTIYNRVTSNIFVCRSLLHSIYNVCLDLYIPPVNIEKTERFFSWFYFLLGNVVYFIR